MQAVATARAAAVAAVIALVSNTLIVLTGALVRLTGSGLGCPTWPRCTGSSFVNTPEMGVHGVIEFGNRVLGIVVGLITIAMVVLVLRHAGRPRKSLALAIGVLIGVGAQGLIGGLSVQQELAPEIVAVHFLVSMVLVAALTVLVDLLRHPDAERRAPSDPRVRWVVTAVPVVLGAVLVLGTLVTGNGPHAGDREARRFALDSAALTSAHAIAVLILIGLQVAVLVVLRATSAPTAPRRAALALLAVSFGQGVIGAAQAASALPVPLVAAHVVSAALVVLAATRLVAVTWRGAART